MLFVPIKFKTHVRLSPSELDSKYQERIYDKLRSSYEGVCTKYGYIKPESIEIVKRSYGSFIKEHFNGFIKFEVVCRAEVCNPVQGSIVKALIKNKNQLGILAESLMNAEDDKQVPILDIIIPIKSAGIISQVNLDSLSIGDMINVEVMGKKYQINDKKISIIGRVISPKKEEEEVVPEEEEMEEELEEDFVEGGPVLEEEEEEEEEEEKKKRVITMEEEESEDDDEEDSEENEFEEDFYEEEEFDDEEAAGGGFEDDEY